MIQPNFIELDWRVCRALELAEARPDARSSVTYAPLLKASLENFRKMTEETDLTYTRWRSLRGEQMKAFRDLRIESDRTYALCDEHGLDGYPSKRIIYTDEQELMDFTQGAIAYLQANTERWKWVSGAITRLETGRKAAAELKREELAAYRTYTERAKDRIGAYDHLFGLFRDYLRDARGDLHTEPLYQELRLVRG